MVGRLALILASTLLVNLVGALPGKAPSATGGSWRSVSIERHAGAVGATLTYQSRRPLDLFVSSIRRVRLVVRHSGRVVLDSPVRTLPGIEGIRLHLQNVWGGDQPEALVSMMECGNRCSWQLAVGLTNGGHGRLLWHDFGGAWAAAAWQGERRAHRFYFVSRDQRFFCVFSDCASSTTPVRVFVIDEAGTRFVDVTRMRPDLIAADAASLLRAYRDEIRLGRYSTRHRAGYDPLGLLAPWCADEYLLGTSHLCRLTIAHAFTDGYLSERNGSMHQAVRSLYAELRAWGYAQ